MYFNESNDGFSNRKYDWLIVSISKLSYEIVEAKAEAYCKKHHRGCFYFGISGVQKYEY